jgi:hypothetical protein
MKILVTVETNNVSDNNEKSIHWYLSYIEWCQTESKNNYSLER